MKSLTKGWHYVTSNGDGRSASAIYRNTAARKQSEDILVGANTLASTVFESAGVLILVLDRNGFIVRFNHSCEELTGWTSEEVKGRHIWDLFVLTEEAEDVEANFRKLVAGGSYSEEEHYWAGREGRRLISWTNTVSYDASGQAEYVISVGTDLTEQKQLEREVLMISERERKRIGQDLHDGLGQLLTGILLLSRELSHKLSDKELEEALDAAEIHELAKQADAQAHRLVQGLMPVELEVGGLPEALRRLIADVQKRLSVTCTLDVDGTIPVVNPSTSVDLYRIAQEALNNAIKHGRARCISVHLSACGSALTLIVEDDGVGIHKTRGRDKQGLGLRTMTYRAKRIGATLTVRPRASGGTVVTCSL